MGQGNSIPGQFGKYTLDQSEENRLGKGGCGTVYKARGPRADNRDGIVAVKVIDKAWMNIYALREMEMNKRLSQLRHPNLVAIIAWKEAATQIFVVTDYYPHGDLYSFIKRKGNGLSTLHSMNIIHRDLKTMNVLLEQRLAGLSARLTDFGFARELNDGSIAASVCGTREYLAPECLQDLEQYHYTKESDMWSLGTILFEIWTGRRAFKIPPFVYDDTMVPQTECRTPSWVQLILHGLLRHRPSERMTIELIKMPLVTQADVYIPKIYSPGLKEFVKNADMSEEMQRDAIEIATHALKKYTMEKDIASCIKKEFDEKYNPRWHCVVGRDFGSCVSFETSQFLYFYLGQVAILLFKSENRIVTLRDAIQFSCDGCTEPIILPEFR